MFASDQIHNPMRIDAVDQLPESITYGFLVRTCTRLNDHIFIAAELTIDHLIPKSYVYKYSYHTKENEQRKFPVYGSPPTDPQSKSILIVEKSCGYGDALTTLPLLQKFTDIYIQRGMRVEILHYYRQSYELSSVFLGRCQNQMCDYIDNRKSLMQLYVEEKQHPFVYNQIYNFDGYVVKSAATKLYEIAKLLNYPNPENVLEDVYVEQASPNEALSKLIAFSKKFRYVIGVQFQTAHDEICFCKRSWSSHRIAEFLSLCRENGIGVVNLAPCQGVNWNNELDFSTLPIPQLFGIVQKLDLMVGIDSCFEHIAAVLHIPSLTIWGKPLKDKSQRPLCGNYSLVSKRGDIDSIKASDVIQRSIKILTGELAVSPTIRPVNTVDDYYAEWID